MRNVVIIVSIIFLLLFVELARGAQFSKIVAWSGIPLLRTLTLNINIDSRVNFYTENGYSLGSELCQGQKFKISTDVPSAEWIEVGAWEGEPPILWVDDIKSFGNSEVLSVHEILFGGSGNIIHANVICESPEFKNLDVDGVDALGGDTFLVTSEDIVNINFNENLKCVFYISEGGKIIEIQDVDKTGMKLAFTKSLKISKPFPPRMALSSVLTDNQLSSQSSTYMKTTISNTGNKEITIKDVGLNVDSKFLTCTSNDLEPGESTECIFSVSPKDSSILEVNVKYQYLMCGERYERTDKFEGGYIEVKPPECLNNSECDEGYVCCTGMCYDSATGMCADVNADGVSEWIGG